MCFGNVCCTVQVLLWPTPFMIECPFAYAITVGICTGVVVGIPFMWWQMGIMAARDNLICKGIEANGIRHANRNPAHAGVIRAEYQAQAAVLYISPVKLLCMRVTCGTIMGAIMGGLIGGSAGSLCSDVSHTFTALLKVYRSGWMYKREQINLFCAPIYQGVLQKHDHDRT